MNLDIRPEYLVAQEPLARIDCNACAMPPELYPQSRDWTCALACLRTVASGLADIGSDDELIARHGLAPGPYYSKGVKCLGMLDSFSIDAVYGCDINPGQKDVSILWKYMRDGWRVMANWLMSYDHWTVMLAYIKSRHGPDYDQLIYYDPYCDEVLTIRAAHFSVMWTNPSGNDMDFIAVREK